jgi:hypothetical protein
MTARPVRPLLDGLLAVVLTAALVATSACGGDDQAPTAAASPPSPSTVPVRVGSIGDAVEVAAGAPGDAGAAACTTTEQTLTMAADAFLALEGAAPADQQALVEAGLVREPSPWFEITADGVVAAVPGGPCA